MFYNIKAAWFCQMTLTGAIAGHRSEIYRKFTVIDEIFTHFTNTIYVTILFCRIVAISGGVNPAVFSPSGKSF
jgi:hypothetical protein